MAASEKDTRMSEKKIYIFQIWRSIFDIKKTRCINNGRRNGSKHPVWYLDDKEIEYIQSVDVLAVNFNEVVKS